MPVQVDDTKCVGCGICESSCPRDAIEAYGVSEIDTEKCTECFGGTYCLDSLRQRPSSIENKAVWVMTCIRYCPAKALSYSS